MAAASSSKSFNVDPNLHNAQRVLAEKSDHEVTIKAMNQQDQVVLAEQSTPAAVDITLAEATKRRGGNGRQGGHNGPPQPGGGARGSGRNSKKYLSKTSSSKRRLLNKH